MTRRRARRLLRWTARQARRGRAFGMYATRHGLRHALRFHCGLRSCLSLAQHEREIAAGVA